jgi:hypothetical protein
LKLIKVGEKDKLFAFEDLKVKKGDVINVECLLRGGIVVILEK